jgi:predicted amidohydrolase YtcJ
MTLGIPYTSVEPAYYGNVTTTQDDLNAWMERMHRAGVQVNSHTNGDVTIDSAHGVRACTAAVSKTGAPITHRILINDEGQSPCCSVRLTSAPDHSPR